MHPVDIRLFNALRKLRDVRYAVKAVADSIEAGNTRIKEANEVTRAKFSTKTAAVKTSAKPHLSLVVNNTVTTKS